MRCRATPLRLAALVAFAAAAACAHAPSGAAGIDRELARIVNGEGGTERIAGAALAVAVGGRVIYAGAAGCAEFDEGGRSCARPLRPDSKLRVASISKMALAMGLMTLVDEERLDLDRDASDYLGWPLRNPSYPDRPITVRQLLSHTSSIRDPEEYWVAAPGRFHALFEGAEKPFAADDGQGPGEWFCYANLNYGVLAAVIEGVSRERFDRFMTARLFAPSGLDVGYNWSGVSRQARSTGAALPQREGGRWKPVVDAPAVLSAELPYFLADEGVDRAAYLEAYRPGDNPTLFSPQGGLRASVMDLVQLVSLLSDESRLSAPAWRYDGERPNGDTENGFYTAFGLGVQTVDGNAALLDGAKLIGHSGDAYGLHSGAWILRSDPTRGRGEDIAFAFVSTGFGETAEKGKHPTFNAVEERLVRLALALSAPGGMGSGDSPLD